MRGALQAHLRRPRFSVGSGAKGSRFRWYGNGRSISEPAHFRASLHTPAKRTYTELGNNSLEPRFAGNSRSQVSVNRVTGDTVNRVTGDMVRF